MGSLSAWLSWQAAGAARRRSTGKKRRMMTVPSDDVPSRRPGIRVSNMTSPSSWVFLWVFLL
jgi:hypothetical protein